MAANQKLVRDMSRAELVDALLRFNPFGGYSVESEVSTESLRRTVVRFGTGPATDQQIDEVLAAEGQER
jgi:hypothetical protein